MSAAAAIRLVPFTTPLLAALEEHRSSYAAAFPFPLSPDWPNPDFLDALGSFIDSRAARPADEQWVFLIVECAESRVVGEIGAKGPPTDAGELEVGYGIAQSQRGRSFATAAVRAFQEVAFSREGVRTLTAECLSANGASVRVLEKCGFLRAGTGSCPEGALLKWRLDRPESYSSLAIRAHARTATASGPAASPRRA